jgi:hypothetical protein
MREDIIKEFRRFEGFIEKLEAEVIDMSHLPASVEELDSLLQKHTKEERSDFANLFINYCFSRGLLSFSVHSKHKSKDVFVDYDNVKDDESSTKVLIDDNDMDNLLLQYFSKEDVLTFKID